MKRALSGLMIAAMAGTSLAALVKAFEADAPKGEIVAARASSSFPAELVKVFEAEGSPAVVVHVELDSVQRTAADQYTVWTIDDYKVPVPSSLFSFRSTRKQHLIDCESGTDTRLQAVFYELNMGTGLFVHRGKLDNQPQPLGGHMKTVANMLCSKRV